MRAARAHRCGGMCRRGAGGALRAAPPPPALLLQVAALSLLPRGCRAGGGTNLWDLGDLVNDHPNVTFQMYFVTVILIVVIEIGKHWAEHRAAHDGWRPKALDAVWAELMTMGVVAFILMVMQSVGIMDVMLKILPGDACQVEGSTTSAPTAVAGVRRLLQTSAPTLAPMSGSAAGSAAGSVAGSAAAAGSDAAASAADCACDVASGSSTGSEAQCIQNTFLLFEFAHLVLFFMGIFYGLFMQVALGWRQHFQTKARKIQEKPMEMCVRDAADPGWCSTFWMMDASWERSLATLRASLCIRYYDDLQVVCNDHHVTLEQQLAHERKTRDQEHDESCPGCKGRWVGMAEPLPNRLPKQSIVTAHFDMGLFIRAAMSMVLLEMLHIKIPVWGILLFVIGTFTLAQSVWGLSLKDVIVMSAPFGPVLAVLLTLMLSSMLSRITRGCLTDPTGEVTRPRLDDLYEHDYNRQKEESPRGTEAKSVRQWKADPWGFMQLENRGFFHSRTLSVYAMQMILVGTCFFMGQLMMLSSFLGTDTVSASTVGLLWLSVLCTLGWFLPRCLLLHALVHMTGRTAFSPSRPGSTKAAAHRQPHHKLLRYACGGLHEYEHSHGGDKADHVPGAARVPAPSTLADIELRKELREALSEIDRLKLAHSKLDKQARAAGPGASMSPAPDGTAARVGHAGVRREDWERRLGQWEQRLYERESMMGGQRVLLAQAAYGGPGAGEPASHEMDRLYGRPAGYVGAEISDDGASYSNLGDAEAKPAKRLTPYLDTPRVPALALSPERVRAGVPAGRGVPRRVSAPYPAPLAPPQRSKRPAARREAGSGGLEAGEWRES